MIATPITSAFNSSGRAQALRSLALWFVCLRFVGFTQYRRACALPLRYSNLAAIFVAFLLALAAASCQAAVDPVAVRLPEKQAWTGERLSFFVEIRVSGSFGGATTFSLPEVAGTIIVPVGSASVSSQEIDGDEWFVQTHEFSLFSQTTGTVEIPAFPVHYGARDGFTGPVKEVDGTVPPIKVKIKRPPGSEDLGFLITTDSLEVSETWDPTPGDAKVGAVFKRVIKQHTDQMTGIALPPAPQTAPDGIRVYAGQPVVDDNTERGAFEGTRTDTLTYLVEKPGAYTLPAIKFSWWNPMSEKLQSKTLPAVSFQVAAPKRPVAAAAKEPGRGWIWGLVCLALGCLIFWFRQPIQRAAVQLSHWLNPEEKVVSRRLLRACRRNDAKAAYEAWLAWPGKCSTTGLREATANLERDLYSDRTDGSWDGAELAAEFRKAKQADAPTRARLCALPPLNP